jgi:hypothetical protein
MTAAKFTYGNAAQYSISAYEGHARTFHQTFEGASAFSEASDCLEEGNVHPPDPPAERLYFGA